MPPGCGGSRDMDDTDEDCVPTCITYVGFKGKATNVKRQAVEAVYETLGMKKDHQVPGSEYFARQGLWIELFSTACNFIDTPNSR